MVKVTLQQATKGHRESRGIAQTPSLTSALEAGGWPTPRPGGFTPRERPDTHCTGDWVGPKAGQGGCEKSRPLPGFDPRTVQPVAVNQWIQDEIMTPEYLYSISKHIFR